MKLSSLFLLLTFCSLSISNPDFETLLSFKAASGDSDLLSSWSSSSDPCSASWVGVTCNNGTKRITRLALQNLNLTGSIQTLSHLTQLRLLSLKNNSLSSSLNFSSWTNMKLLYLSYNHFSGSFPAGIFQLRRLRRLDLSHNRLSGNIPMTELTRLPHLLTLRLEENSFTGILSPLDASSPLSDFNVSENNLYGEIPKSFSSFGASSFTGNKNLCGKPLPHQCLNRTVKSDPAPGSIPGPGGKRVSDGVVFLIVIIDALVIVAMIGVFVYCRKRRMTNHGRSLNRQKDKKRNGYGEGLGGGREEDEEMVFFEGCKGFRVDDLLKASAEMLGKGSVGTTYKVVMEDGDVVVVKRARERKKKKEVEGILREIGRLRHSNIVSLRAYYCSKTELLLVYDYLPNGSLHSLLHGNRGPGRTPLDWTTRLKLASDAAKGLAFLHGDSKTKLAHGQLTSLNIIVDQSGNACVSDIGLRQLFLTQSSSENAYKAPELMPNSNDSNNNSGRKFSNKCDVYSFGVILLEILTGKMATGEGETSLAKWVQRVVREEWTSEVFDIELLRFKEMEEEMMALLQVALLCLAPMPRDRPKMSVVHDMIVDIRARGSRGGGGEGGTHSPYLNDLSSHSSPCLSADTPNFTSS